MRFDTAVGDTYPISLIGAAITTAMAVVFPCCGARNGGTAGILRRLLLFVAVPAVFLLGLLLYARRVAPAPHIAPATRRRLAGLTCACRERVP